MRFLIALTVQSIKDAASLGFSVISKNSPTFGQTTCRRQARGGQPPHDSPEGLFRLLFFYLSVRVAAENRVVHYASGLLPCSLER